jgi:acetamidase/formamidase
MAKGKVLLVAGALVLGLGLSAQAQQKATEKPKARTATHAGMAATSKHYWIHPNKENTQWGWLDPTLQPILTIHSGDRVSVETWYHALNQLSKPLSMDEIVKLRLANDGGGPHSVTGPVYVNGAEPGDTIEIRILRIVPKDWGQNFNLPGKQFPKVGLLAPEFPEGGAHFFKLNVAKMTTEFKPGITLHLKPFPGVIADGPDPNEPTAKAGPPIKNAKEQVSTLRPWKNGSNMDLNELQAGSTIYFPVFEKGALIWTGDSHCLQGNGEVDLEALECAYKEIELEPIVLKNTEISWPMAENKDYWIFTGFDEDLNQAMKIAVENTVDFLSKQKYEPMSREEAYQLTSLEGDCRVTEVVDIRKGVHCMIPKSIFAHRPPATGSMTGVNLK